MKIPELLSPAGDLARLKVALRYGADAVYIGGEILSMRAKAKNFTREEMQAGVEYAHGRGKRVYVAVNVCAHNADFATLDDYLMFLAHIAVDAILVSDVGVFARAQSVAPNIPLHISTQANVTNFAAAGFWQKLGASRIVLARELSLSEIAEIYEKTRAEIEVFTHGAMCMAYSGRCLISNFLNARDANRGECSQPCRFSYTVTEEKTGAVFPIVQQNAQCEFLSPPAETAEQIPRIQGTGGTHIFNSKDLNMVAHLPQMIDAGVAALKIEGRMKTEYYVGAVTKIYREALNDYAHNPADYAAKIPFYTAELEKIGNRGYTTGFFFGKMTDEGHDYAGVNQATNQDFLGLIESFDQETGLCLLEQRNKFSVGDKIEILRANGENFTQHVENLYDESGAKIISAPHPKQKLLLQTLQPVEKYDMVRRDTSNIRPVLYLKEGASYSVCGN